MSQARPGPAGCCVRSQFGRPSATRTKQVQAAGGIISVHGRDKVDQELLRTLRALQHRQAGTHLRRRQRWEGEGAGALLV